jgi:hypothetical protein
MQAGSGTHSRHEQGIDRAAWPCESCIVMRTSSEIEKCAPEIDPEWIGSCWVAGIDFAMQIRQVALNMVTRRRVALHAL